MSELLLSARHKSIPPDLWGRMAAQVAGERHPLSEFPTPLLTFDRTASDHNVATLFAWAEARA